MRIWFLVLMLLTTPCFAYNVSGDVTYVSGGYVGNANSCEYQESKIRELEEKVKACESKDGDFLKYVYKGNP